MYMWLITSWEMHDLMRLSLYEAQCSSSRVKLLSTSQLHNCFPLRNFPSQAQAADLIL